MIFRGVFQKAISLFWSTHLVWDSLESAAFRLLLPKRARSSKTLPFSSTRSSCIKPRNCTVLKTHFNHWLSRDLPLFFRIDLDVFFSKYLSNTLGQNLKEQKRGLLTLHFLNKILKIIFRVLADSNKLVMIGTKKKGKVQLGLSFLSLLAFQDIKKFAFSLGWNKI